MKLTVEVVGKTAEITFTGSYEEFKKLPEFDVSYHLNKVVEQYLQQDLLVTEIRPTEVPLTKLDDKPEVPF